MPDSDDYILSSQDLPLQSNHDEIGSFRGVHKSGKKDDKF